MNNIDEKIKQNRDIIAAILSQSFNVDEVYEKIKLSCSDIKRSKSARKVSFYGLFPPHKDIEILSVKGNYGRLTDSEKNNDFVYYFDAQGRIILTERYNVKTVLDNPLIELIFFEYNCNEINIRWYDTHSKQINLVERCVLDENGKLLQYLSSQIGFFFGYKELLYSYDNDIIRVLDCHYVDSFAGMYANYNVFESHIANNNIIKSLPARRFVYRNEQWTEVQSMMDFLKDNN